VWGGGAKIFPASVPHESDQSTRAIVQAVQPNLHDLGRTDVQSLATVKPLWGGSAGAPPTRASREKRSSRKARPPSVIACLPLYILGNGAGAHAPITWMASPIHTLPVPGQENHDDRIACSCGNHGLALPKRIGGVKVMLIRIAGSFAIVHDRNLPEFTRPCCQGGCRCRSGRGAIASISAAAMVHD